MTKSKEESLIYGFCCTNCGFEQIFPGSSYQDITRLISWKGGFFCNCTKKEHSLVTVHRHIFDDLVFHGKVLKLKEVKK